MQNFTYISSEVRAIKASISASECSHTFWFSSGSKHFKKINTDVESLYFL